MVMSELPNDEPVASATPAKRWLPPASAWLKELPYVVVLVLTLLGVAYTSVTRRPTIVYWEFLVMVTAVACIWGGWRYAPDRKAKVRLIGSQALHWLAFFVAMNLVLLPSVQNMLNADATGLAILLLLALGRLLPACIFPRGRFAFLASSWGFSYRPSRGSRRLH